MELEREQERGRILGRSISAVHYESRRIPTHVPGLYSATAKPGEPFTKGFYIHRGAGSIALRTEQGHLDLLIMDENSIVGLRRYKGDQTRVRLMRISELRADEERIQNEMGNSQTL